MILFAVLILLFGVSVIYGAPYLPTLKKQRRVALGMLNLKKGQTLLDLGSGDGRMLLEAARQGIKGVGYEINPLLVIISKIITFKYRREIKIIWGNFWQASWPKADGAYVFLRKRDMARLNKKVIRYPHKPLLVASYAFKMPNTKPQSVKSGVYLYNLS